MAILRPICQLFNQAANEKTVFLTDHLSAACMNRALRSFATIAAPDANDFRAGNNGLEYSL